MIKEVVFYQAQCDVCGALDDGGEFSAWAAADDARTVACDAEWTEFQVKVPTTTPRGSNIYIVTRDGQEPFLERSILVCGAHTGDGVHWCAKCEDDLNEDEWSVSVRGDQISQTCPNRHLNEIRFANPETHVEGSEQ